MDVTFCGVGEAFDPWLLNTSLLLQHGGGSMLLDCGFTAAHSFWSLATDPLGLDAVWVSHFHGDHFFGLPALFLKYREEGRTRPLALVGQRGLDDVAARAMDLAFGQLGATLEYEIVFHEAEPGQSMELAGFTLDFAENDHSTRCLAIRAEAAGSSVFYSGDGRPTGETLALASEVDLVVHEAYSHDPDNPGHGTVQGAIDFARDAGARALALVHIKQQVRMAEEDAIRATLAAESELEAFLPETGDRFVV
jgi:ribonuclease BN (tRNA processing enzyme)